MIAQVKQPERVICRFEGGFLDGERRKVIAGRERLTVRNPSVPGHHYEFYRLKGNNVYQAI